MNYHVDEAKENFSAVPQTEWHTETFKQTEWSSDGGLNHVFRSHWNFAIDPHKVDNGKYYLATSRRNVVPNCDNG